MCQVHSIPFQENQLSNHHKVARQAVTSLWCRLSKPKLNLNVFQNSLHKFGPLILVAPQCAWINLHAMTNIGFRNSHACTTIWAQLQVHSVCICGHKESDFGPIEVWCNVTVVFANSNVDTVVWGNERHCTLRKGRGGWFRPLIHLCLTRNVGHCVRTQPPQGKQSL